MIMSHTNSTHTHRQSGGQRCIFPFQIELQRPDWIFLLCIKDKKAHYLPLPPALSLIPSVSIHPLLDFSFLSTFLKLRLLYTDISPTGHSALGVCAVA